MGEAGNGKGKMSLRGRKMIGDFDASNYYFGPPPPPSTRENTYLPNSKDEGQRSFLSLPNQT